MQPAVVLPIVGFVALALACIRGSASGVSLSASFARVLDDPWGLTMVVDLNVGFLAFLVVVWLVEPRRPVAVAMTLLTPVLGNFVPLAWLVARGVGLLRARAESARRP